ncbi:MAG TPA: dTDP-glucose 4,6-dehydratase [Vicinamibacterales bacterium]|nr:dTDP-glucose 4,6-dehydratase [Vicinamibacterales bacterium]
MVEVLITGGAGFIGSNFIRYALDAHPDWRITTVDKLTYAGRLETLHDLLDHPRHKFVRADVCDEHAVGPLVKRAGLVVHFAAETHVDRSLVSAEPFIQTDIVGTYVMLEAARKAEALWRFIHVSTDEVYGSVEEGASREDDELRPRNPYSACKAAADRLAYSYFATFGLPIVIARPSNNYGPYQFPEKVIPLFTTNAIDGLTLPLYGDGQQMRDWLHVRDNCRAIDLLIAKGQNGEAYNIGGGNEVRNIDLTRRILRLLDRPDALIEHVTDRIGHDRRYCLDSSKIRTLGWSPTVPFEDGLRATVEWYRNNEWWWRPIKESDPAYRAYYQSRYGAGAE